MAELYLYNGVKLPKIPDTGKFWNDLDYKYVLIRRYFDNIDYRYTAYYSSGEFPYYEEDGTIFISGYDFCSTLSEDLEWETPYFFSGAGARVPASSFFWTSHEIKSASGDIIVPAPDPVLLVGSVDYNAMIQGWIVGKRLAAMRGQTQQVTDTARLGLATLGRMILGKE